MVLEHITKGGISVPILKNKVALEPHAKLMKFKAKEVIVPLSNASIIEEPREKKQRK